MNINNVCVEVTPRSPRVVISMAWTSVPVGEQRLYVRRLGETDDFAYYPAIETNLANSIFQVDELLFDKGPGRYTAALTINDAVYATIQLNYKTPNVLVGAENPNV